MKRKTKVKRTNTLYLSKDETGTTLMTEGNVYHALNDGKTIKISTEWGVETFNKDDSPSNIMMMYGSYHYQFGTNVLFPLNIDEITSQ